MFFLGHYEELDVQFASVEFASSLSVPISSRLVFFALLQVSRVSQAAALGPTQTRGRQAKQGAQGGKDKGKHQPNAQDAGIGARLVSACTRTAFWIILAQAEKLFVLPRAPRRCVLNLLHFSAFRKHIPIRFNVLLSFHKLHLYEIVISVNNEWDNDVR